jgi:tRNA/tmRNA/rRNA uracil-C5-methylase (TrmA/RlmC/RlmD family)
MGFKFMPIVPNSTCHENCPGCAHRKMTLQQSLDLKMQWLNKILSIWSDRLDTIRSMTPTLCWQYRNRVCLHAQWNFSRWKIGLMRRDEVVDLRDCPVHSPLVQKAVHIFSNCLPSDRDFPLVFYAQSGTQVTLVVKQKTMPDLTWLDDNLMVQLKSAGIAGLWLHMNPGAGKNVFAKNIWHLLWGVPRSRDSNGLIYGPRSFQQVAPSLYQHSLGLAEKFLSPESHDLVIDLYCGRGAGLVRWSAKTNRVMGVELDGEAFACARVNAPSVFVLRGKCKDRVPQLIEWVRTLTPETARRLIYLNPPRTGLEPEILDWLAKDYQPDCMAYLSCSAGTLRRDMEHLEKSGYDIIRITPYDFFPHTHHVECLALIKNTNNQLIPS